MNETSRVNVRRTDGRATEQAPEARFAPPVDIYETNEQLVLLADMPGVTREQVDLTLEKGVLTLRGRVRDHRPEGGSLVYGEYEAGDYERAFALPEEIDVERIEARMEHGVLTLTLPKARPSRRKIEIQVG